MKKILSLAMIMLALILATAPSTLAGSQEKKTEARISGPINLNTATVEQLQSLPGVGPVTAQRIIDYRHEKKAFTSTQQLLEVKGVGEKLLAKIQPMISLE